MSDRTRTFFAPALREPAVARWLLAAFAVIFLALFLVLPLVTVFYQAFSQGVARYFSAVTDPYTWAATRLTLLSAFCAVLMNSLFGLALAWLVTHFVFPGRKLLLTLLDLPLAVSPVVAGMIFVFLFGSRGWLWPLVEDSGWRVIFATPGILLCTTFVTVPFVARELIPVMQQRGSSEEEAALVMGASGWQTVRLVTLPAVKWGLLYGVILCNARAMGEFGAVSVVSGHIRGKTNTLPLHIEILYNEYQFADAFAVSSLLALLALVTLGAKQLIERHNERESA